MSYLRTPSVTFAGLHFAWPALRFPPPAPATPPSSPASARSPPRAAPPRMSSSVAFSKYHGLGNDFVLVDCRKEGEPVITPDEAAKMCDRNFGVGADGADEGRVPSVGRLGRRLFVERIGGTATGPTRPPRWCANRLAPHPLRRLQPPPTATSITRAALRKYFSHPTHCMLVKWETGNSGRAHTNRV